MKPIGPSGRKVKIDLTGKIVGRLTVNCIHKNPAKNDRLNVYWECTCSCGTNIVVSTKALIKPYRESCGCLQKETRHKKKLPRNVSAFNELYSWYRSRAKRNNRDFNLTKDEFKKITSSHCTYCNRPPLNVSNTDNGCYYYNGIDRKNNEYGYTIENSLTCCEVCNYAKNSYEFDFFKDWISRVYTNLKSTGQIP